ncbi:MAG: hypothetical protein RLZZ623_2395, partial [Actinomycetota bacterium]
GYTALSRARSDTRVYVVADDFDDDPSSTGVMRHDNRATDPTSCSGGRCGSRVATRSPSIGRGVDFARFGPGQTKTRRSLTLGSAHFQATMRSISARMRV